VAFRFVAANQHPDHNTIATFRRRFLPQIEHLFVKVLMLVREMGVLKMGTVALDGTKIHANANRHSALSYEHAGKIKAQLQAEHAAKMAGRDPKTAATGRKPDGKTPAPPVEGPGATDQINLKDEARAPCPSRAAGSTSATTRKRSWLPAACW